MHPFFPPLSIACLYSISQDSCCFHLEAKPWISASVLTFGRFLHGTIQTFHLIFMDTVMYIHLCCMDHSSCLDRMKNSFEYITLSYLSGGISFSNIHRSFVLTCIRKHQKKFFTDSVQDQKKGMQYHCNLSMIFEYPFFKHQNVRKPHKKSILLLCIRLEAQCLLSVIYISFFDAYASSSSNG